MHSQATLSPYLLIADLLSRTREAPRSSPFRNRVRKLVRTIHATAWREDPYLLATTLREASEAAKDLGKLVHVEVEGELLPRPCVVAVADLKETKAKMMERAFIEFVNGAQANSPLPMNELWAIRPALLIALLERYAAGVSEALCTIRDVSHAIWDDIFESISVVDRTLVGDPADFYCAMDEESMEAYRGVIGHLARFSPCSEVEVASAAVSLASEIPKAPATGRAALRRRHVGFYLVGQGRRALEARVGYRAPLRVRFSRWILDSPTGFYLIGVEVLTFLVAVFLLSGLPSLTPILGGLALLLLPATHAAVHFMNTLAAALVPPRFMPKLDFEEAIPAEFSTVVAVPALLINEKQLRGLVRDLEIRYLANPSANLFFGLLTDHPDAQEEDEEADSALASQACRLIDELNQRYGGGKPGPFFLLHRFRSYNESEGAWIGWERKRGKLLDLNAYIGGGQDNFPVKSGAAAAIRGAKYVITLDADTQLPPGAAAKMVGALAHPLQRAVLDPFGQVVEGYGIIQPRVSVSVQSVSRSRLAHTYSGQAGFDLYTKAVSDVYQDLFGEGIFTGKGIYEVDVARRVLETRFPANRLLSHDLMEGLYARTALATDIEVVDDYPSHYSAYCRRQHRWIRGDWQVLRWMLPLVPDSLGRLIANPISLISRWKILDNVRRSLIRPATLLLMLAGWFVLPGPAGYWTLATIALLLIPVYSPLLLQLLSILLHPLRLPCRRVWAERWDQFVQNHAAVVLEVTFLIEQSLSSLDAIVRSLVRTRITRKRLLEWETAAQAEGNGRRPAPVDRYLKLSPVVAAAIGSLLYMLAPGSLPEAAPILFLWAIAPLCSRWLNRPPKTKESRLKESEKAHLGQFAARTWKFFEDFSSEANHFLIPDSAKPHGDADQRLSPTNLGMLLNARIAAVKMELLPLDKFVILTRSTLASMLMMRRESGHFLNWYNSSTLEPLAPLFVSTVDSGNLAGCLWTLKQACLEWAEGDAGLRAGLEEIASIADGLVNEMDFRLLYRPDRKTLSVGYDVETGQRHHASYDLLASEARLAVFAAIALGQIPHKAWLHLSRTHTLAAESRVLMSWSGTAFEYLMPAIWMRSYERTLLASSMEAIVNVQKFYMDEGDPWGISECAYGSSAGNVSYGPCGLPDVAMQPNVFAGPVISPYSAMLAMMVDLRDSYRNLKKMEKMGWAGEYGFFEAADYSELREDLAVDYCLVRTWMAHHQGMSLLALTNVLHDNYFQKLFHAEPRVEACERLLHEKLPADVPVIKAPELECAQLEGSGIGTRMSPASQRP